MNDYQMTSDEWLQMALVVINRCPRMMARAVVLFDMKQEKTDDRQR